MSDIQLNDPQTLYEVDPTGSSDRSPRSRRAAGVGDVAGGR
jgi:hypothetical protein